MPSIDFSIDFHQHPNYKALGRSYKATPGVQSTSPGQKSSLWYYDPPKLVDKILNFFGGLTKFSQTNLTASAYGRTWVISIAMGTIEKWFFNNRLGTGFPADVLDQFASEVSIPRINAIQGMEDYFADLMQEFEFIEKLNNTPVNIDGHSYLYRIVNNFAELDAAVAENEANIIADSKKPIIIAVIPSIEGLHILNCGLENPCKPAEVIANITKIKNHPRKPWFVTFSHHFFNELCGHSRSLRNLLAKVCNQEEGLGTGFTDLGKQVLDILMDNSNGKRILLDIKHLSPLGRQEFFAMREQKYPGIPVIITHGVCNGLPDMNSTVSDFPELGNTFNNGEINFYDNEILLMAQSGGIMGLQLDERRLASEETIKRVKHSLFRNKIMHYRSELVWNHIQYVAELLDSHNLFAWGNLGIGSDYDGIVDALNAFWTTEQYPELKSYLERHAFNYMTNHPDRIKNSFNKIGADEIVQNIFQTNGWNFLKKWF